MKSKRIGRGRIGGTMGDLIIDEEWTTTDNEERMKRER